MSWYNDYYKPSRPRAARGGIKAQSKRGEFGKSWWAKRWISVLESFNIGARLGRGKSYARQGQVISLTIDKGRVSAKVQGSRSKPYDITIKIKTLSSGEWQKIAIEISHQAIFAAKLLVGEMPQDIEEVFRKVGLSLFPVKSNDLETDCSCPDWSNPCKHIAAVYYIIGEEFDRDPFLLFKLRGMERDELMGLLNQEGVQTQDDLRRKEEELSLPPEPLTCDPSDFWAGGNLPDHLCGEVRVPSVSAALPKRLGNLPFWRAETKFLEAIEPIYNRASSRGMTLFLGESL